MKEENSTRPVYEVNGYEPLFGLDTPPCYLADMNAIAIVTQILEKLHRSERDRVIAYVNHKFSEKPLSERTGQ